MKKIISLVLGATVLTSCGSNDGGTETTGSLKQFKSSEFAVSYPDQWEVLTEKDFPGNVPVGSMVAFRSNVKDPSFTSNITIVTMDAPANTTSTDFVKGLSQKHAGQLKNYKEVLREEITLQKNGEDSATTMIVFEGKRAENEDLKRFYQTALVNDKKAYVNTAAVLSKNSEAIEGSYIDSIESFELQ